jgi:ubiquinone/menaquinone biosynthesis C-methylase UbiE
MNYWMKTKPFDGLQWAKNKGFFVNNWKKNIDQIATKVKDKTVLDAGCGTGYDTHYFAGIAKNIIGIDTDVADLQQAVKNYQASNLTYIGGTIENLPFIDSSFDVVYSSYVVEHLKHPEHFFNELHRVLKPRGIMILLVPNIKCMVGVLTKYTSFSFQKKVRSLLENQSVSDTVHHECFYRANSVKKIEALIQGRFQRIYLQRFDSLHDYRNSRILTYLWALRQVFYDNKLLKWLLPSFYIEFRKN